MQKLKMQYFLKYTAFFTCADGKKGNKYKSIMHSQYLNHLASEMFLDLLYPSLSSFLSLGDVCHNELTLLTV